MWSYFCGYEMSNLYVHFVDGGERTNFYKIMEDISNQLMYSIIQFVKKQNFSFSKLSMCYITTLKKFLPELILVDRIISQIL